ncbi:MAG TPA: porin [Polyangia bacterium]|nr:porin [Polyangia bacterium]
MALFSGRFFPTLALIATLAWAPALRAQKDGAGISAEAPPAPAQPQPAPDPSPAPPPLAPPPPDLAPSAAAPAPAPVAAPEPDTGGKKGKKHKKAVAPDLIAPDPGEVEDGDAGPVPEAPGPDDSGMSATGEDPFGNDAVARFDTRMLLQVRYGRTQVDPDSLVREGELDANGLPYSASEAAHQAFFQRLTAQKDDGFTLHRAFLRFTARMGKHVKAKFLVDFADIFYDDAEKSVKLAYLEAEPAKRVRITAGLFKRTFSLLELLPIARFELADTGPTDNFIKDLGWAGRDVGVMVEVDPLPKKHWLRLYVGSYSGDSLEGYDAKPWKLLTARAEIEPIKKHLRFGADVAWRPATTLSFKYKTDPTAATPVLDKGLATSADVTVNAAGLEVRAEGIYGARTDIPFRGAATRFLSTWLIARYLFPVGAVMLMPALRAEWLDADVTHAGGGRFVGGAALNIGFTRNVWLMMDVSRHNAQAGAPALNHVPSADDLVRGLDADWTAFTLQLQLEI